MFVTVFSSYFHSIFALCCSLYSGITGGKDECYNRRDAWFIHGMIANSQRRPEWFFEVWRWCNTLITARLLGWERQGDVWANKVNRHKVNRSSCPWATHWTWTTLVALLLGLGSCMNVKRGCTRSKCPQLTFQQKCLCLSNKNTLANSQRIPEEANCVTVPSLWTWEDGFPIRVCGICIICHHFLWLSAVHLCGFHGYKQTVLDP